MLTTRNSKNICPFVNSIYTSNDWLYHIKHIAHLIIQGIMVQQNKMNEISIISKPS